ncbi:MAG: hypothetical protein Q8J88_04625 [Bacteroidales bacterium]|nr:hypothetical protein [Bacteroidales bacterium]
MKQLLQLFGFNRKKTETTAERASWPLSAFKLPGGNQPQAWNNRFGRQNSWTKQFSKLWSLSLRSLW